MGYYALARYYDAFTLNVDYKKRAEYFKDVFTHFGQNPKMLLDMACGTGSLTFELAKLGYDMIGLDSSQTMLEMANFKKTENTQNIMFIQQSMQELELLGKTDGVICALDSINHLPSESVLEEVFKRVSMFIKKDGLFIFDVNTKYKHKEILGDNCFVYQMEDVFCVWQNTYYNNPEHEIEIQLDIFELLKDGNYSRQEEVFSERIFSHDILEKHLESSNFKIEAVFAEDSFDTPSDTEQRLIYVSRKTD